MSTNQDPDELVFYRLAILRAKKDRLEKECKHKVKEVGQLTKNYTSARDAERNSTQVLDKMLEIESRCRKERLIALLEQSRQPSSRST
jgi:hypothetical protein